MFITAVCVLFLIKLSRFTFESCISGANPRWVALFTNRWKAVVTPWWKAVALFHQKMAMVSGPGVLLFFLITATASEDSRIQSSSSAGKHLSPNWMIENDIESYRDLSPEQIYGQHENGKKRSYAKRVMEIEQGTFTPLVFSTTEELLLLLYSSQLI